MMYRETAKRILDLALAIPGLVVLSPALGALAVVVKADSPGPVLYRRRVMGRGGTQLDGFKFRTMAVNGDEILARNPELRAQWLRDQKLKDDPRVTHSGRWLRRLSLDELPLDAVAGSEDLGADRAGGAAGPGGALRRGSYTAERFTRCQAAGAAIVTDSPCNCQGDSVYCSMDSDRSTELNVGKGERHARQDTVHCSLTAPRSSEHVGPETGW